MNRNESRILRESLKRARQLNKFLWWNLKREIWDLGYQTRYPSENDYQRPVNHVLSKLSDQHFQELQEAYCARFTEEKEPSRERVSDFYSALMIEEIVRRATIASLKTINW